MALNGNCCVVRHANSYFAFIIPLLESKIDAKVCAQRDGSFIPR